MGLRIFALSHAPAPIRRKIAQTVVVSSWAKRVSADHREEISNRWHVEDTRSRSLVGRVGNGSFITGMTNSFMEKGDGRRSDMCWVRPPWESGKQRRCVM